LEWREYIPAFDGLRAVAIIGVLLFHLGGTTFSVGWTGVILFFVLSGYLITGILLDAKGSGGYFRNFYIRRALRIFPAYYLVLLLTAATIYIVAPTSPVFGPGAFEMELLHLLCAELLAGHPNLSNAARRHSGPYLDARY
jgi:peptidoglycan/LPS O-acetylase OafA/YrhL